MSVYEEMRTIFRDYSPEAFKGLHHEDFMFVRETDLTDRDSFCASIDELHANGDLEWKRIELIHENQYVMETRWRDGDEVVTRVNLKKDGLIWRAIVSRIPFIEPH